MITTPEEYYKHLAYVQSVNAPTIAVLPSSENVYEIDLRSRTIDSPEFISVTKDHQSETLYFKVNRFHDYMDLAETTCMIQYITPDNKARIYIVPFYDITTYAHEDKMLFPWCIDGGATGAAGVLQYSVRFFKIDGQEDRFAYNLNTLGAKTKILLGMDVKKLNSEYDLAPDVIDYVASMISDYGKQRIYWDEAY